jgi:L-ascorbate metabolism protein UlaG (beta-lactamase superfamily)
LNDFRATIAKYLGTLKSINLKISLMKNIRRFYWLFLLFALSGFTNQKKEIKITSLGNCGYLYECNQTKVLIDPFGTEFGNFFYLPTDETRKKIIQGNAPFDKINVLLITHLHGDHFNARLTESFLLNNGGVKMICPPQVCQQMKDSCKRFAQIESQIISPGLSMGESKKIKINDLSVTAIRMQHGTNRSLEGINVSDYTDYEKTENFGYVIHFAKETVFHQGDGCLRINEKALKKINCPIDIALLGFFDWDTVSYHILKKDLKAQTVIFMHGTKPAKELESEPFKEIKPRIVFFHQELESKIFN